MVVTLKDGSKKEYSEPKSVIEIASDISEGLARVACVAELDGEVVDLRTIVDGEHTLNILTFDSDEGKAAFRHTASHVLAQAIKRLYPDAKCAIGPSIEEGFYYDFDIAPLDREALDKIEKEMKKIVKEGATLERFTLPRQEAIDLMRKREEPYKVELIEDLPEDAEISFYQQGEYIDMCIGPHLTYTKALKAFKLTQLSGILTKLVLVICVLIFGVQLLRAGEFTLDVVMHSFMIAVSLAVAAIPEGLAAVVTVVLSIGVTNMSKRSAIIRRLTAVETLGCAQIICSDKTGTLTQNKMTVVDDYGTDRDRTATAMTLCSDAALAEDGTVNGEPTEAALVAWGAKCGLPKPRLQNELPRVGEAPFDSGRKMMSTVHKLAGGFLMVTKGAVDVLLERSIVTPEERRKIEQVNEQFSNEGLRVLAFACRSVDGPAITLADENSLTFLGLIAMMDPPREESKAAVAECIRAGIRPIMITGDHKITAAAIAREIGILRDDTEAVEGEVIDGMSDEELQEFVPKVSVYARVSPEHKIRIVRAWQQRGNLVAMTGDGVNDAPALKQADIGVAMGITGTEVAKDAAGMVLADDNFATIVKAVKNGRNVYANIKRAIQFLLSGNTAGILTVLYASLMGLPVPFAAVHLLFINLLTDSLPAIALGMEPHTDEVMSEKPRPRNEGILTKHFLYSVGVEGLVIAAATVTAFYLGLNAGGAAAGQTMAFSTLCLSRLFHGFSCKSQHPVLLTRHFWNNRALLGAFTIGALLLGLVLLVPALEPLFAVAPLSIGMVGAIVGLAFGSMVVIQLLKLIRQ